MSDDKECKSCALLRRYEKTARERGYAMGKAAGNNELAQAQELLAAERKAHAETNTALTAEITRLEAQLAAAAPGAVPIAHVVDIDRNCNESIIDAALPVGTVLYAAAAPGADERKPVAWHVTVSLHDDVMRDELTQAEPSAEHMRRLESAGYETTVTPLFR